MEVLGKQFGMLNTSSGRSHGGTMEADLEEGGTLVEIFRSNILARRNNQCKDYNWRVYSAYLMSTKSLVWLDIITKAQSSKYEVREVM